MINPTAKRYVENQIAAMENKLLETKEDAESSRGPVQDALRIVIPMMEDQLQIQKSILIMLEG